MAVLLVGVLTCAPAVPIPYEFRFDEVHHARTMECQDWRYGMPHDIYEFTHPHLAKYAMAEGITYLGDNKVTSTVQLGARRKPSCIEPGDDNLPDRAGPGDRFHVWPGQRGQV